MRKHLPLLAGQTHLPGVGAGKENCDWERRESCSPPRQRRRTDRESDKEKAARCKECRGANPSIDAGEGVYFCNWDCASIYLSFRCCPRCRGVQRHGATTRCARCDVAFQKDEERKLCEERVQSSLSFRGEILKTSALCMFGSEAWEIPQALTK